MLTVLLLVIAAVCFALAIFDVGPSRVNLVALGLLCWILTLVVPALHLV